MWTCTEALDAAQGPATQHTLMSRFMPTSRRIVHLQRVCISAQGSATQHTLISRFMPTSRRIVQFSDGRSAPPDARIVYIDGAFDLLHPGHVQILKVRASPYVVLLLSTAPATEGQSASAAMSGAHNQAMQQPRSCISGCL